MDVTFPAARQLQTLTSDLLENHGVQSHSQNTWGPLIPGTFFNVDKPEFEYTRLRIE